MSGVLRVAVVGCGLIGRRRSATVAAYPGSRLVAVVDSDGARARAVAEEFDVAVLPDWRHAVDGSEADAVVVCTPNDLLAEVACAALERGKHVLIEKPMGRGYSEARNIARAAASSRGAFRVGFNHRYHPGIARAHALAAGGELGELLSIRVRYGHGSRPGCETEWRADPARSGGGELMDQGVHVADLIHWLAGLPAEAFCITQTAFWRIAPLEDNAWGLFRWEGGRVAQLHVSMTQWKNLFSFEVFCEGGSIAVEGLGGSYGEERLVVARRRPEGGSPDVTKESFDGPDGSWAAEWAEFVAATSARTQHSARPTGNGDAEQGLAAMRMIDALYRSAAEGRVVRV